MLPTKKKKSLNHLHLKFPFSAKETSGRWPGLGSPLADNGWYGSLAAVGSLSTGDPYYRPYVVANISSVTPDTVRLVLRPKGGDNLLHLLVPPGRHVQFRRTVRLEEGEDSDNSMVLVRSYTPVPAQFMDVGNVDLLDERSSKYNLCFLIKIYPTGALTPCLGHLQPGAVIDVSDPSGDFVAPHVIGDDQIGNVVIYLLAAGTGITPMLSILPTIQRDVDAVAVAGRRRVVVLLYFNRRERDIICRELLEQFAAEHSWLEVTHVLSEEPAWPGHQGRVRRELLHEFVETAVGNRPCLGIANF
jgi:ferredoxin-NADP reductase